MIVAIPFRDRGIDPRRAANLVHVIEHWETVHDEHPLVVGDGRHGDEQFNRSAAYNRARLSRRVDEDVYVFTEADMLIPPQQISDAVVAALAAPGLVVPFTQYRYLSDRDTAAVRAGANPASFTPESTMEGGRSIGAINVVSARTLNLIGQYDEQFEGSWFDDNAMRRAFELCAGPTRWITGPAWHMYHLPGWSGGHLSDEDRAATLRNRARLDLYEAAETPQRIRELTSGALA